MFCLYSLRSPDEYIPVCSASPSSSSSSSFRHCSSAVDSSPIQRIEQRFQSSRVVISIASGPWVLTKENDEIFDAKSSAAATITATATAAAIPFRLRFRRTTLWYKTLMTISPPLGSMERLYGGGGWQWNFMEGWESGHRPINVNDRHVQKKAGVQNGGRGRNFANMR